MTNVSVVIPLYNDGDRIERAVNSVLRQNYRSQVIIVDDCSVDDSFQVAQALSSRLPGVRALRMAENAGPAAARNLGARLAEGEYICFLDSDDEFLDGYFREIVPVMASAANMHAVKVGMEFYDPVKGYVLPSYDRRYIPVVFSSPCNIMIRRASFDRLGGFSEDPVFRGNHGGEDIAFCKALAEHLGPLGRIDKVYYRCWSCEGSHVDNFLASTRQADNPDGFEFIGLDDARKPGGELDMAIMGYLEAVKARLADKDMAVINLERNESLNGIA